MAAQQDLRDALTKRQLQRQEFSWWERSQVAPAVVDYRGVVDGERLQHVLRWYDSALAVARRAGTVGASAPETHLEDVVEWVRRWRRAWRAE